MFINTEHQSQVLSPDCYHSQEHFGREMDHVFRPAWHCVGTMFDLPQDGAYKTFTLFGHPLILWRHEGEVHAFLNVCAHRYCKLTSKECGNLPRLTCQYHGWEYDETGNTQKIPDAKSFRPLERGILGLKKYRTEVCGQLIFVSLAEDGPGLEEQLGPGYDTCRKWFHDDLYPTTSMLKEIDANWKCLVENALESYHTTIVHPKTFGPYPDEEQCTHELSRDWTALNVKYGSERSFRRWLDDFAHLHVGAVPRHEYDHVIYYPNLMLARLSLYTWFESIIPISPSHAQSITCVFCYAGKKGTLWSRWMAFWITRWGRNFLTQVAQEDAAVMPFLQEGLSAPEYPKGGLISTREERIVHFQEYIQRATGCPTWTPAETNGRAGGNGAVETRQTVGNNV